MKKLFVDKNEVDIIVEQYLKGSSLKDIALQYNCVQSTVMLALNRNGIKTNRYPLGEKNPKRIFTDAEEMIICKEYAEGKTLKEVGDKRNVSLGLVGQILKRCNVHTRLTKTTGKVGKYTSMFKHGLYNTREYQKFHKAKRRALGDVKIKDIQETYEDNIKQYGTLTCYLCSKPITFGDDHLEHKTPVSRGGSNNKNNLAVACSRCNLRKNIKTEEEFKQYLLNKRKEYYVEGY